MAKKSTKATTKKGTRRLPLDGNQASQLVGIIVAMIVAVLVNVVVSRRFTRWDWTSNKRYSLSPPTVQTLHDLPDHVQIWVLLGPQDPLEQSVKHRQGLRSVLAEERQRCRVAVLDPNLRRHRCPRWGPGR